VQIPDNLLELSLGNFSKVIKKAICNHWKNSCWIFRLDSELGHNKNESTPHPQHDSGDMSCDSGDMTVTTDKTSRKNGCISFHSVSDNGNGRCHLDSVCKPGHCLPSIPSYAPRRGHCVGIYRPTTHEILWSLSKPVDGAPTPYHGHFYSVIH